MNPILNHIPNLKHLGSGMFFVMAGPCVVENEEVMMRVAEKACAVTDALKIPYIFKASYRTTVFPDTVTAPNAKPCTTRKIMNSVRVPATR